MVEVAHQGTKCQTNQKRCTKVQPFSFEERDRQLQKIKEEKIKKILDEEKKLREFHANPVPNFSQPAIGSFSTTKTVTDPINLQFRTDRRLEERHKREKPAEDKDEKFVFRAKPAVVLKKAPFEPKKGDSALTDVTAIHLNTEERAKKREEFNCKIKEREATIEQIKYQRRQEEEKQQMEEVRRMRREAEHKAAPFPRNVMEAPFRVRPSTAPLTEPKTPKVLSRKRKHQD
ncbi:targeting protein for Xklp2 homolog [Nilaparvata lugens]|uniref:targeting protein for Xklp2 homolog n=1 Tax=Nilaparvata lugens TaxID=108931 RepID=UPI00193CE7BF|nr:targeting protein for Xklp2 homolog [Nilaparvata lugens]